MATLMWLIPAKILYLITFPYRMNMRQRQGQNISILYRTTQFTAHSIINFRRLILILCVTCLRIFWQGKLMSAALGLFLPVPRKTWGQPAARLLLSVMIYWIKLLKISQQCSAIKPTLTRAQCLIPPHVLLYTQ